MKSRSLRPRFFLILAASILPLALGACHFVSREPNVYVPVQKTARQQYIYAMQYRETNDLMLRDKTKMDRVKKTRTTVRKTFEAVIEYFPQDREVTPLAKVENAEMLAGQDRSNLPPKNRDLREAIKLFQKIRGDYHEIEFIQARTQFDEAICWQNLKDYEKAQGLYREVSETYAQSKDKDVRLIVQSANRRYQQTYVK